MERDSQSLQTENRSVERLLIDQIRLLGGLAVKYGRASWPDRICILPYGIVVWVEAKRPTGTVSKLQRVRINYLKSLGHWAEVVTSKHEVLQLIKEINYAINRARLAASSKGPRV